MLPHPPNAPTARGSGPSLEVLRIEEPSELPANSDGHSPIVGVWEVESTARVPFRALIAVRGDPTGVLEYAREVEQVPGHEGGVAVGEVVLGSARARVEVARARTGFADPARVGLRRDHIAEMLE